MPRSAQIKDKLIEITKENMLAVGIDLIYEGITTIRLSFRCISPIWSRN